MQPTRRPHARLRSLALLTLCAAGVAVWSNRRPTAPPDAAAVTTTAAHASRSPDAPPGATPVAPAAVPPELVEAEQAAVSAHAGIARALRQAPTECSAAAAQLRQAVTRSSPEIRRLMSLQAAFPPQEQAAQQQAFRERHAPMLQQLHGDLTALLGRCGSNEDLRRVMRVWAEVGAG